MGAYITVSVLHFRPSGNHTIITNMSLSVLYGFILILHSIFSLSPDVRADPNFPPKLFREYIGAEGKNVKFSDVPINSNVEFHFILSFAIDYSNTSIPLPTNGNFTVYWDTDNLTPAAISQIKSQNPNVKVAMSLGGDTVGHNFPVNFTPSSIDSWVENAINSVSKIVEEYNLDGIDIDYEHFAADPETFATCIGRLLHYLKNHRIVSFTSIAPFAEEAVQEHYLALWRTHGRFIDYVNFQFYAYDHGTTVTQFLQHFEEQSKNYEGGKILVSFGTDNSGGLSPANGFFNASSILEGEGKLHGIFIWSADDSKKDRFFYEKQAQDLLAS